MTDRILTDIMKVRDTFVIKIFFVPVHNQGNGEMIVSDQNPNDGSSTTQYINLQFSDQQDIGEEDDDEGQVLASWLLDCYSCLNSFKASDSNSAVVVK